VVVLHPHPRLALHHLHHALHHLHHAHLHHLQVPSPSGMEEGIAGTHVGGKVGIAIGAEKEMLAAVVVLAATPLSAGGRSSSAVMAAIIVLHSQAEAGQPLHPLHRHHHLQAEAVLCVPWTTTTFGNPMRITPAIARRNMASGSRTRGQGLFVSSRIVTTLNLVQSRFAVLLLAARLLSLECAVDDEELRTWLCCFQQLMSCAAQGLAGKPTARAHAGLCRPPPAVADGVADADGGKGPQEADGAAADAKRSW
jgi:hypothetical protein